MPEEIKENQSAPSPPKPKAKPEKVKLKLIGAGSCNYEGIILKKNEIVELEVSRAEQFMQSGLFEQL